jgi:hypothetical protein
MVALSLLLDLRRGDLRLQPAEYITRGDFTPLLSMADEGTLLWCCVHRSLFNFLAGMPNRRPFSDSVTAFIVTLSPSGFHPRRWRPWC